MAFLDRIKDKYGFTGGKYQDLITQIIDRNTTNISKAVAKVSKENYERGLKKIKKAEKRFIIPDISEVLPNRDIMVRKAADKGKLITDTLRDDLSQKLRDVLTISTPKTQEARFLARRGKTAGRISPTIINEYEKQITGVFSEYTKKGKSEKVPSNIHSIAVTEIRSTVNDIKNEYATTIVEKNNGQVIMKKTWIHNPRLSRKPRLHHVEMNGHSIPLDEMFLVGNEKGGSTSMRYPHDPAAPPEQVISCNCDVEYFAQKLAPPDKSVIVEKQEIISRIYKSLNGALLYIEKKAKPIGSISERKDGLYKKVSNTGTPTKDWVRIKDEKGNPVADVPKETRSIRDKYANEVEELTSDAWSGVLGADIAPTPKEKAAIEKSYKKGQRSMTTDERITAAEGITKTRDAVMQEMNVDPITQKKVDDAIYSWLGGSDGDKALGMQVAMNKILGKPLDTGFKKKGGFGNEFKIAHKVYQEEGYGDMFEKAMVVQMAFTQSMMNKLHGSNMIRLYRGTAEIGGDQFNRIMDGFKGKKKTFIEQRPMASFSSDKKVADKFGDITFKKDIDTSDIFMTAYSHPRAMTKFKEDEHVVIGSHFRVSRESLTRGKASVPELNIQDIVDRNPVLRSQIHNKLTKFVDDNKGSVQGFLQSKGLEALGDSKRDAAKLMQIMSLTDINQTIKDKKLISSTGALPYPNGIEVVKNLGGSTGAKLIKMPSGQLAIQKEGQGEQGRARLEEEHQANELYRAMGVDVPNGNIYTDEHGGKFLISSYLEGAKELGSLGKDDMEKAKKELQKGFVADALLGNWDVAGLTMDNIMIHNGKPVRVDNGGALRYRGMGAPKGDKFGDNVDEITTMRQNSLNPSAAAVFGGISDEEIASQVKQVTSKKNKILASIKDPKLRDKMNKRIDSLKKDYSFLF